jgi:hypothetical protein
MVYDLQTVSHRFSAGIGELVVHNTDSIFTLIHLWEPPVDPETGVRPVVDLETLCRETGRLYDMKDFFGPGQGFEWSQVVQHYATGKRRKDLLDHRGKQMVQYEGKPKIGVDLEANKYWFALENYEFPYQVNAFLYLISEKLCEELGRLFRSPIAMEFENMANKVWMGWVKKCYTYNFWDPSEDPSTPKKIKITGMESKSRAWSPWTRRALMKVTEFLLKGQETEIKPFLEQHLTLLVDGKVPIKDLMISKEFKTMADYKHFQQVHLQVKRKIEERTRWPVREKSRIYFVILEGEEKLYLRSETPEYAAEHKLNLDLVYYLKNQFATPMTKLLTYHPQLINFPEMVKRFMMRLQLKKQCIMDVGQCMQQPASSSSSSSEPVPPLTKKRKLLTVAEYMEKRRNKARKTA